MARYKGVVTQSVLDWYAGDAQAAQQWFSQATAFYWAFTLKNNSIDGTRLWVYDAESVSGAAFPAGTGNPGGNPLPIAGYQGGDPTTPVSSWQFISQNQAFDNQVSPLTLPAPASIVAGNLLILAIVQSDTAAANIAPPDATWVRLGGIDGNANAPGIAVFAREATGGEPANYSIAYSPNSTEILARVAQFSGNPTPPLIDVALGFITPSASTPPAAPAVRTTVAADLVYVLCAQKDTGQAMGPITGVTGWTNVTSGNWRFRDGYVLTSPAGVIGPFVCPDNVTLNWSAITLTFKTGSVGAAPAQALAAPIASVSPLAPGTFGMVYSASPIALSGITRWIPPAAHFQWHRESPLAIIDPATNFNLAGIAPEFAAWASLTWLAIK